MEMRLRERAECLRAIAAELPAVLWIVSLGTARADQKGGIFTHVKAEVAAQLIHDGTARPATEEESTAEELRQLEGHRQALARSLSPLVGPSIIGARVVLAPAGNRNGRR
jgi:hypothetical protein